MFESTHEKRYYFRVFRRTLIRLDLLEFCVLYARDIHIFCKKYSNSALNNKIT